MTLPNSLLAKLNTLRRWVDCDEALDDQISSVRLAEEFLMQVASEIGHVLEAETFTPPGGAPIIPHEFIVFLSLEDDRAWQGLKRRGLEHGLAHTLRLKTSELFDGKQLATASLAVELRVDGTLQKGQFRVRASWDTETDRTRVTARLRNAEKSSGLASDQITPAADVCVLLTCLTPRS